MIHSAAGRGEHKNNTGRTYENTIGKRRRGVQLASCLTCKHMVWRVGQGSPALGQNRVLPFKHFVRHSIYRKALFACELGNCADGVCSGAIRSGDKQLARTCCLLLGGTTMCSSCRLQIEAENGRYASSLHRPNASSTAFV